MTEQEKILYFAYGANRDPRMMSWITGNENLIPEPATLRGFKLCVQRLDQVPQKARQILVGAGWPDTFTSYIIKEDERGLVRGNIYELTPLERELVRDWELIDLGWYEDKKTKALVDHPDGGMEVEVVTEGLRQGQEVDHEVDGVRYEVWLNSPEEFEKVAKKSRAEYFERNGLTPEGKPKTGIESQT